MKELYSLSIEDTLNEVKTTQKGLNSEEAEKRKAQFGENKLLQAEKPSMIERFIEQLKDPMLIILMIAAAVSAITGMVSGEGEWTEVIIIVAVVLLNAILGVIQESKAEAAIEALQTMTAATCKVIRDDHQTTLHSSELVPGDIVVLEAGDAVPADGRIIESASLKIEEAALTGESVPVNKTLDIIEPKSDSSVPLGDRKNMCYMGSTVVYGRGKAVITNTGMSTEMGKIAGALSDTVSEETPLQKKLDELGRMLSKMVLIICVFIFLFNLFMARSELGESGHTLTVILKTFMVAVSLAVAAIPEGLATVVTVVLSIGVTKMSQHNAVIRKLTAVETLGCTEVICSDKTGTLTQNRMTVVDSIGDKEEVAKAMALCSDALLNSSDKAEGEPTECALVNFAFSLGLRKQDLEKEEPRVDEAPFDSGRKMMSTVHALASGSFVQYTKGGPDVVISRCTKYLEDGVVKELDDNKRKSIMADNKAMADKALRVLASAKREWMQKPESNDPDYLEENLIFLGLCGMIDPVRPEVKAAIDECKSAGIRAVMITGDHKDTAVAIAKELGIIKSADEAITGSEIEKLSDEELAQSIKHYGVYARVQPEHKTRIVNAWKKNGSITAMTGDGVNDAPSIKSADIGVGMGITGTDVTKNVADMVLADDNFATIVSAVGEGRRIYDNIRKAIQFLLGSNMSEVLGVFTATVMGFTLLNPVHLLFINLVTDCFPALALGLEDGEEDIMKRPPRSSEDGIFAGGLLGDIIYQGILVTALTIISYIIGNSIECGHFALPKGVSEHGMTMAFLTMSMCEIFHSFNMRSQRKSIFTLKSQNKVLWIAMFGSLVLTTAVLEIPFLADAFGFTPVGFKEYAIALILAFLVIPIVEIVKLVQRMISKKKK